MILVNEVCIQETNETIYNKGLRYPSHGKSGNPTMWHRRKYNKGVTATFKIIKNDIQQS